MKKIDVRVKRTYKHLIEALMELLSEKSFDDITVLEICERASVHRATFYKHFVDKFDFINVCIQIKLSEITYDSVEKQYTPDSMKRSCMSMIEKVLDFVDTNRKLFTAVSNDTYSLSFNTVLTDSIAKFIAERISTIDNLKSRLGYQIKMLANYYAGAIVGLIKWWVTDERSCNTDELLSFAEFKINDLCNYFNMFVE